MKYHRIKGFKIFKDRHGKMRCYHRVTGVSIDLSKHPLGSPTFVAETVRITNANMVIVPKAGTLGMLIKEYKKSPAFQQLRGSTRTFYSDAFEFLRYIEDARLVDFDAPAVALIRDKALARRSWHYANKVKTTLSVIFSWGAERGLIKHNPAKQVKKIKRPKEMPRANRPWTKDEWELVYNNAPAHILPVLASMFFTGIDPCDAIGMAKTKYRGGAFDLSRQKTGNPVWKPLPKAMKSIIEEMPEHDAITLFANSNGKPWTKSAIDSAWLKLRSKLGLQKGLTLKGLRHTYATTRGEMGESSRVIADSLGDKSEAMGTWYSRDASTKKTQQRVVDILDKHHGKIVKPSKDSVKP